MDPELLLIFSFIIIMTTVLGLTINGVVQKVIDYKMSKNAAAIPDHRDVSAAMIERTEMVEDRLAVLERIAIDRGTSLADEIEALIESPDRKEHI